MPKLSQLSINTSAPKSLDNALEQVEQLYAAWETLSKERDVRSSIVLSWKVRKRLKMLETVKEVLEWAGMKVRRITRSRLNDELYFDLKMK